MQELNVLFLRAGLSDVGLASKVLGIHRTTIQRIRRNEIKMNKPLELLLRVMSGEVITDARQNYFKGWKFNAEFLYSPENERFSEGDIRNIRILYQQLRDYRIQIRELKSQIDSLNAVIKSYEVKPSKTASNVIPFPNLKQG